MILRILVTISVVGMLMMNYLANSLPIGGNTTGEISSKYPTLFTPSGFTFSIWGIIYFLVIIFTLLMFIRPDVVLKDNETKILWLFLSLNVLNGIWLIFWHNDQMVISTIVISFMLIVLLFMITSISKNLVFSYITFSVYAGWISIATIANITILLYKLDIPLFMNNESFWFIIVLLIGIGIALFMGIKEKNIPFSIVYVWAYFGIVMKFL